MYTVVFGGSLVKDIGIHQVNLFLTRGFTHSGIFRCSFFVSSCIFPPFTELFMSCGYRGRLFR